MKIIVILSIFLILAFYLLLLIALTVLIETPIIVRGGITDNKVYIRGVNIVTNVLLNMSLVGLLLLSRSAGEDRIRAAATAWFLLAELLLIPVSESLAYRKISSAGTGRIFLFTYLANLASCAAGLILEVLIRVFFN